jgi:hypothetical protein
MSIDFNYIIGLIKLPSDQHSSLLRTILELNYNGCETINIKLYRDATVPEQSAKEWEWLEHKYLAYSKTSTDYIKQIQRHLISIEKAIKNLPLNSSPNMAALRYLKKEMDLDSFNRDLQFSYKAIQNAGKNFTPYFESLLKSQLVKEWYFNKTNLSWEASTVNNSRAFKSYLSISFANDLNSKIVEVKIAIYLGHRMSRNYDTFWKSHKGKWICISQHISRLS